MNHKIRCYLGKSWDRRKDVWIAECVCGWGVERSLLAPDGSTDVETKIHADADRHSGHLRGDEWREARCPSY